ncbi:MAG: hypothetical protein IJZ95_07835 [Oscillospiraceae bacterium]|nr:hypothetical protein [Oscillospiraceae bacterium]
MKKVHTAVTISASVIAVIGIIMLHSEPISLSALSILLLTSLLQPLCIRSVDSRSRLFRMRISLSGFIALISQCGMIGILLVTDQWWLLIGAVVLLILLILSLIPAKPTELPDPDPTGRMFTSQLTEMLDTISRATAERPCGIDTEMLYEQARFSEPSTDSTLRPLERRILSAICELHPDDSDEVISQKCSSIMQLLDERSRKTAPAVRLSD